VSRRPPSPDERDGAAPAGELATLERRAPLMARASIATGIVGIALGLCVGLAPSVSALAPLLDYALAPYGLGGAAVVLAGMALIGRAPWRLVAAGAITGIIAILAPSLVTYVIIGIAVAMVILIVATFAG